MTPDEARLRRRVGKRVRVGRVLQELSQEELAQKAGVKRNFVSAIERGAQGLDAYRLGLVAKAFGLGLADLLSADALPGEREQQPLAVGQLEMRADADVRGDSDGW